MFGGSGIESIENRLNKNELYRVTNVGNSAAYLIYLSHNAYVNEQFEDIA